MKFCKKCGCDTERYADGQCKPCRIAYAITYKAARPENNKLYAATYRATNADKIKAYYFANADKIRAKNAAWRKANPERVVARSATYKKANPEAVRIHSANRRAQKRTTGTLSKGLSVKLFALQHGKCACCSLPLGNDFHLDHVMPLALGGVNQDGNIQLLRSTCNLQKKSKHPIDFMQARGFLL